MYRRKSKFLFRSPPTAGATDMPDELFLPNRMTPFGGQQGAPEEKVVLPTKNISTRDFPNREPLSFRVFECMCCNALIDFLHVAMWIDFDLLHVLQCAD